MTDEYELPLRFLAHYEGGCGMAFEIFGIKMPYLNLPCEECNNTHKFQLKYIEHR